MANRLKSFQREALAAIAGAFKTTAGPALDVELHVEPIFQKLTRTTYATVNRVASTPAYRMKLEIRRAGGTGRPGPENRDETIGKPTTEE